eukprot:1766709-Rhodomonas_salina.2
MRTYDLDANRRSVAGALVQRNQVHVDQVSSLLGEGGRERGREGGTDHMSQSHVAAFMRANFVLCRRREAYGAGEEVSYSTTELAYDAKESRTKLASGTTGYMKSDWVQTYPATTTKHWCFRY